jgi:hypothetical protein
MLEGSTELERAASPKRASEPPIDEAEDLPVAWDLVERREGAELPDDMTAGESVRTDSACGLSSVVGECKIFDASDEGPVSDFIERRTVSEIDDRIDDCAEGTLLKAGVNG